MTDEQKKRSLTIPTAGSPEKLWQILSLNLNQKFLGGKITVWLTNGSCYCLLILVFNSPVPNQPEEQISQMLP